MSKKFCLWGTIALAALTLSACGGPGETTEAMQTVSFASYSIQVPASWQIYDQGGPSNGTSVQNAAKDSVIQVFVEAPPSSSSTLDSYLQHIDTSPVVNAAGEPDHQVVGEQEHITLNGYPAIRRQEYLPSGHLAAESTYVLAHGKIYIVRTWHVGHEQPTAEDTALHARLANTLKIN